MKAVLSRLSVPMLALLMAACASKPGVHLLDNSEYGETITLQVDEILEIQVYSQPANGMQWKREGVSSPVLVEMESRFESLRPDAPDAGGVLTLRLRAGQPGTEVLRYVYRQDAQSDALPADRVDVVVEVE